MPAPMSPVSRWTTEERSGYGSADNEIVRAGRAVIADVSAPALYGGLVDWDQLPGSGSPADAVLPVGSRHRQGRLGAQRRRPLARPAGAPPPAPCTSTGSVDDLGQWMTQINSGLIPADPFLLIGQMTTADPTRSPAGTEALWAYTHVPQQVRARRRFGGHHRALGPTPTASGWPTACNRRSSAPRPGSQTASSPAGSSAPPDLQNRDANLVGGALNGGTAALHQQLVFRPIPGLGRAETPIHGLYLGSAAAHPGGGVHGACGANAARAALTHNPNPTARTVTVDSRRGQQACDDAKAGMEC